MGEGFIIIIIIFRKSTTNAMRIFYQKLPGKDACAETHCRWSLPQRP